MATTVIVNYLLDNTQVTNRPANTSLRFRVDTGGDLPTVGVLDGDSGFAVDTGHIYLRTGGAWVDTGVVDTHAETHENGGSDEVALDASQVTTGQFAMARIASGTPTGSKFVRDDGVLAVPAGGSSQLIVPFHADGSANITMTNQANSEQFLGNSNRNITRADLTNYTQYRLVARVVTGSASANTPRLYAQFHTSFSTTASDYSPLGDSGDVNASLTNAGLVATAWTNLASAAKADVFLTVMQNGGDGTADPAVGPVMIQFK